MKTVLLILFRLLVLAAVTAAFFGVPGCWIACKAQGLFIGLALTFFLGRFFCRSLCPLGMLQSLVHWLFHPIRHVRRVCTRLPESRAQRIVRWSLFALLALAAACGGWGVFYALAPYSIYGKAVARWWPGLALLGLVLALAPFGRGRLWCNWVCPYGTLFTLLSRLSLKKDGVAASCGNCRACFAHAQTEGKAEDKADGGKGGLGRRETLKGVALLAVTDKIMDGGFAPVSRPGSPDRGEATVLPPGAGDRHAFMRACVACQLCVTNCPSHCLKPSVSWKTFGQPEMNFQDAYCRLTCTKCSDVCPEGALGHIRAELRPHVHMGVAEWRADLCLRKTENEKCTACERKCPVRAIHIVRGVPVVDREVCVGCGACEHVCPVRPQPAIVVKGYDMQRIVRPMSEEDLIGEMVAAVKGGESAVIAKNGVIVSRERGRGVAPLLGLLDAGKLRGTILVDKVIGRAAASICVLGGVRRVYALVMSDDAKAFLSAHGISAAGETMTPLILNRAKTGSCPMEAAVKPLTEPAEMVAAIRRKAAELAKP